MKETSENLEGCLLAILDIMGLYGFRTKDYATKPTLDKWRENAKECGWMSFMKYKTAAFMAAVLGNPLPKKPFSADDLPLALVGGRGFRWIESFLKRSSFEEKMSFATSILFSKKGMTRPGRPEMDQEVKDTYDTLTTRRPKTKTRWEQLLEKFPQEQKLSWADQSDVRPYVANEPQNEDGTDGTVPGWNFDTSAEALAGETRRTVREALQGLKVRKADLFAPFMPSTSANYNNTRAKGGAIGHILATKELSALLSVAATDINKPRPELVALKKFMWDMENKDKDVREDYVYDSEKLDLHWAEVFKEMIQLARRERPLAELVPLSEALKVRVISKGPPLTYTVLTPFRLAMHNHLRRQPVFRLIGEPESEQYIAEQMGETLHDDEGYLSLDYKAATNELLTEYTEIAVDEAIKVIDWTEIEEALGPDTLEVYKGLLVRSLVEHEFTIKGSKETKEQGNGQPMGSVTSFPFLCLLNAAVTRKALEHGAGRSITLKEARLGINGDDGLMRTNPRGVWAWRRLSSSIGLKESVGKVYYSREYLNINSRGFLRVADAHNLGCVDRKTGRDFIKRSHFKPIPFINLGLLYGMKRSEKVGMDSTVSLDGKRSTIGSNARSLLREAPEELRLDLLRKFIKYNWDLLKSIRLPWHIPEKYGGVGLPAIIDPDCLDLEHPAFILGPTKDDLRVASWIYRNMNSTSAKATELPITKVSEPNWKIYQMVQKRLPPLYPVLGQEAEEFETLKARLTAETLFRVPSEDAKKHIDRLYEDTTVMSKRAIRHNEKLWIPTPAKMKGTQATWGQLQMFSAVPQGLVVHNVPTHALE